MPSRIINSSVSKFKITQQQTYLTSHVKIDNSKLYFLLTKLKTGIRIYLI